MKKNKDNDAMSIITIVFASSITIFVVLINVILIWNIIKNILKL